MDKERLLRYLEQKYLSKCEIAANIPLGMEPDDIWHNILENRLSKRIDLPLKSICGRNYWYILTARMISASETIVEELMEHGTDTEQRSSVSNLEEIFFTGYMEGAQISLQDAMTFLQSGEDAQDIEELMLLNNRQAGSFAAENIYHAIDDNYLHNLAYILTNGLDNGGGDFRMSNDIEIPSMIGEKYCLPEYSVIPGLVQEHTAFLADSKIHPLIKAAAAQAWILAIRPFSEGNERLARLLSNIVLYRAGYTFFSDISLSHLIARNSYSYFNAISNILRIENEADMTYFIEYYLILLSSAVSELRARKIHKEQETTIAEQQMAQIPLSATNNTACATAAPKKQTKSTNIESILKQKYTALNYKTAKALIELFNAGYTKVCAKDIAKITDLSTKQAYKSLCHFETNDILVPLRKDKRGNLYAFNPRYSTCSYEPQKAPESPAEKDTPLDLKQKYIEEIKQRALLGNGVPSMVANLLLQYLNNGKTSFTSPEMAETLNVDSLFVRNSLQTYRRKNIIRVAYDDGKKYTYEFNFNGDSCDKAVEIQKCEYDPELIELLKNLVHSSRSTKDRRIGMALLKYLPQGEITRDDYDKAGHLKFFSIDMKFAMQIGLVERITRKKYKIKEHIDKSYQNLGQPQRSALSALYEFFGDDVFSVEMVTAKLDYSSAHISGFLHQFTWMRLLDCKESDNKTYEYKFRVNPTDNPECFEPAA